jgi:hypothetical protein
MELALKNVLVIRLCCLKINNISISPFVILYLEISEVIILVYSLAFSFFYKHAIMISYVSCLFYRHNINGYLIFCTVTL